MRLLLRFNYYKFPMLSLDKLQITSNPRVAKRKKIVQWQLVQLLEEQIPLLGFGSQVIRQKSIWWMKIPNGSVWRWSRIISLWLDATMLTPMLSCGYSYCKMHRLPDFSFLQPINTISSYGQSLYDIMSSMDEVQTGLVGFCFIANKILYYWIIKPRDTHQLMKNAWI